MKCVWLVQERGITIAVCDSEMTANKVIKQLSQAGASEERRINTC